MRLFGCYWTGKESVSLQIDCSFVSQEKQKTAINIRLEHHRHVWNLTDTAALCVWNNKCNSHFCLFYNCLHPHFSPFTGETTVHLPIKRGFVDLQWIRDFTLFHRHNKYGSCAHLTRNSYLTWFPHFCSFLWSRTYLCWDLYASIR